MYKTNAIVCVIYHRVKPEALRKAAGYLCYSMITLALFIMIADSAMGYLRPPPRQPFARPRAGHKWRFSAASPLDKLPYRRGVSRHRFRKMRRYQGKLDSITA